MRIYQYDEQYVYTGASRDIGVKDGAPIGWTRTPPPETTGTEVAYFAGRGGWAVLPERPPAPAPEPEPVTESQRLAALTRVAATSAIVAGSASHEDVKMLADLYPQWEAGQSVELNTLLQYQGDLYKVIQAHTTQVDWPPPSVPALFLSVSAPGVTPEWVQPTGAHDAYGLDAEVTHNGKTWKSLHAANVWEPPTQWVEI